MIKLFYGTDTVAVREAALAAVSTLRGADTAVTVMAAESYEAGQLASAAESMSLFGQPQAYIVDSPFLNPDFKAELLAILNSLAKSPHIFIIIEGTLLAEAKRKFVAVADSVEEFQAVKTEDFNTFALADALAKRDRRTLWLLILAARRAGVTDEGMIGIMWWQLKTLQLAAKTKTAEEAGLKDFPYQKAQRALINFKAGELESMSLKLLALYHDGHGGKRDLALALEEFVLTI